MSIVTYFYDLKSYAAPLPPNSKFVDPYDNTTFITNPNETISSFFTRINGHRISKNYPLLDQTSGYALIVSMLAETVTPQVLSQYFKQSAALPTTSQAISLARALVYEALHTNNISQKQREDRALLCLKCPFHKSSKTTIGASIIDSLAPKPKSTPSSKNAKSTLSKEDFEALGVCSICGCPLQSKIKFQLEGILAGFSPEDIDILIRAKGSKAFKDCWVLSEALSTQANTILLTKKLQNGESGGALLLSQLLAPASAKSSTTKTITKPKKDNANGSKKD